jgi:hypothetical protein
MDLEQRLTDTPVVTACGARFEAESDRVWRLQWDQQTYRVTFGPAAFFDTPSLRLMTYGEPLFEQLVQRCQDVLKRV